MSVRRVLGAVLVATAWAGAAAAATGTVIDSFALPTGVGNPSGITFDGTHLWVVHLGGPQTDPSKMARLQLDGTAVNCAASSLLCDLGAAAPHGLSHDGGDRGGWAVAGYRKLHRWFLPGEGGFIWDPAAVFETGDFSAQPFVLTWGVVYQRDHRAIWALQGDQAAGRYLERFSSTGTSLGAVTPVNGGPWRGLAWDGCTLWTFNSASAKLDRLDPNDGATLESVDSPGAEVTDLEYDGLFLWAVDSGADRVYKIEVVGNVTVGGASCTPQVPVVLPESDGGDPDGGGADGGFVDADGGDAPAGDDGGAGDSDSPSGDADHGDADTAPEAADNDAAPGGGITPVEDGEGGCRSSHTKGILLLLLGVGCLLTGSRGRRQRLPRRR